MSNDQLNRLSIAAFISAGMHRDVEKLDQAKEGLGTGCVEFISTALMYVDHIEALYAAGLAVVGDTPGVYEYEVAEEFGAWYVKETLEEKEVPVVDWACDKLYELAIQFWAREDQGTLRQKVADALACPEQPTQPEL